MTEKKQQNENTQNNEVLTPFTNDLMFALAMRDPDICGGLQNCCFLMRRLVRL